MNNSKLDELHTYAVSQHLHVIGVCEIRLSDCVANSEVNLTGYTLYRKDRSEIKSSRGGGVLLYVHNSLNSCLCSVANSFRSESVWCKLLLDKNVEICVGVCYRSPSADDSEEQQLFSAIKSVAGKQVLVMGDFNYPNINGKSLSSDPIGSKFLNLTQDCFLTQHVDEPTRGNNTLDLVLTSALVNVVEDLIVCEHFSSSDHNIVKWKLICKTQLNVDNRIR